MKTTKNLIVVLLVALPLLGIASFPITPITPSIPMTPIAPTAPADSLAPVPAHAVIDEVIWVVGDEAVLKSDVEAMRMQAAMEA